MTTVTLPKDGWTPRADQLPFWNALIAPDIRTVVQAAHRRWGKDECCLHWAAIHAHQRVGTIWHALPQYGQCRKAIWDSINQRTHRRRIFDAFPTELIEHMDEQAMRIRFKNNAVWQLIGSDQVDSLVGTNPIAVVYSEAAIADDRAFGMFRPILAENGGKQIFISTPRGRNTFYKLLKTHTGSPSAFTSVLSAEDTGIFTTEQLAQERREYVSMYGDALGNALFEQEYLTSFQAAVVGAVWGKELDQLTLSGRARPIPYDPRYPVHTSWDIGVRDDTVCLFWQVKGDTPYLIDHYAASDLGFEHFAEMLAKKPYHYGTHVGPHDIAQREKATALSYAAHAQKLGVHFVRMPNTAKSEQIAAASILLKQAHVNADMSDELLVNDDDIYADCRYVLDTIRNYRFSLDETLKVLSRAPVHSRESHWADALQTFALWFLGTQAADGTSRRAASANLSGSGLQGRGSLEPEAPRLSVIHRRTSHQRRPGAFG